MIPRAFRLWMAILCLADVPMDRAALSAAPCRVENNRFAVEAFASRAEFALRSITGIQDAIIKRWANRSELPHFIRQVQHFGWRGMAVRQLWKWKDFLLETFRRSNPQILAPAALSIIPHDYSRQPRPASPFNGLTFMSALSKEDEYDHAAKFKNWLKELNNSNWLKAQYIQGAICAVVGLDPLNQEHLLFETILQAYSNFIDDDLARAHLETYLRAQNSMDKTLEIEELTNRNEGPLLTVLNEIALGQYRSRADIPNDADNMKEAFKTLNQYVLQQWRMWQTAHLKTISVDTIGKVMIESARGKSLEPFIKLFVLGKMSIPDEDIQSAFLEFQAWHPETFASFIDLMILNSSDLVLGNVIDLYLGLRTKLWIANIVQERVETLRQTRTKIYQREEVTNLIAGGETLITQLSSDELSINPLDFGEDDPFRRDTMVAVAGDFGNPYAALRMPLITDRGPLSRNTLRQVLGMFIRLTLHDRLYAGLTRRNIIQIFSWLKDEEQEGFTASAFEEWFRWDAKAKQAFDKGATGPFAMGRAKKNGPVIIRFQEEVVDIWSYEKRNDSAANALSTADSAKLERAFEIAVKRATTLDDFEKALERYPFLRRAPIEIRESHDWKGEADIPAQTAIIHRSVLDHESDLQLVMNEEIKHLVTRKKDSVQLIQETLIDTAEVAGIHAVIDSLFRFGHKQAIAYLFAEAASRLGISSPSGRPGDENYRQEKFQNIMQDKDVLFPLFEKVAKYLFQYKIDHITGPNRDVFPAQEFAFPQVKLGFRSAA